MVEDEEDDIPITDLLFDPPSISILLLNRPDECTGRIDRLLKVQLRDDCSAVLVLYNMESNHDRLYHILDLKTVVYKEEEEVDGENNLCSIFYHLERDTDTLQFQVIPSSLDGVRDVQAFDYLLGQYAFKNELLNRNGVIKQSEDRNPNIVAQSFENTGTAVRIALRSSGIYTGHAIRFLGQKYTSFVTSAFPNEQKEEETVSTVEPSQTEALNTQSSSDSAEELEADLAENDLVERAQRRKKWAEGVHSAATSLTGAVLYPVRWTGRMASQIGGKGGSDRPATGGPMSKAVLDTVGGIGNGLMSVCKGVTEAIGEVGSAIGDSAMYHSTARHGEDYAETITRAYVDAAGEIGLAGYKVANVATLGWQGVLVSAALEGTTFLVSLYEYLIGPVLLQGYMDMMQMPLVKVRRYFVVLRPWSIAFYKTATDITKKPYKIVPTSMLDTLPKLRMVACSAAKADFPNVNKKEVDATAGKGLSGKDAEDSVDSCVPRGCVDSLYWHRSDYDEYQLDASISDTPNDDGAPPVEAAVEPEAVRKRFSMNTAMHATAGRIRSALTQLGGGSVSHIEICTVDCSTYLLYPPEQTIEVWYAELLEAARRVETIAKRKSGADEIALYRRLELYPISTVVAVSVKRFIHTSPKPSMFDIFTRKRSALNALEEGGDAGPAAPSSPFEVIAPTDREQTTESDLLSPAPQEEAFPSRAVVESREQQEEDREQTTDPAATVPPPPVAPAPGFSDSEDEYECEEFWSAEGAAGLLDGAYLEVSPDDLREGTQPSPLDITPPALSPPTTLHSATPPLSLPERFESLRAHAIATATATEYTETSAAVDSAGASKPSQQTPAHNEQECGSGSGNVTQIKRPFFTPQLQCSVYPVTFTGIIMLNRVCN